MTSTHKWAGAAKLPRLTESQKAQAAADLKAWKRTEKALSACRFALSDLPGQVFGWEDARYRFASVRPAAGAGDLNLAERQAIVSAPIGSVFPGRENGDWEDTTVTKLA
jgi:hypothetical protein